VSWGHVWESAIGTGAVLVAWHIGRKLVARAMYRAIDVASERRRRLRP